MLPSSRPGPSSSIWTFQMLRLVSDAMHRTLLVQATCATGLFQPDNVPFTTGFVGETREPSGSTSSRLLGWGVSVRTGSTFPRAAMCAACGWWAWWAGCRTVGRWLLVVRGLPVRCPGVGRLPWPGCRAWPTWSGRGTRWPDGWRRSARLQRAWPRWSAWRAGRHRGGWPASS